VLELIRPIESYLEENVDDHIIISKWKGESKLPVFLRSLYNFHKMIVLDTHCILIEIVDEAPSIDSIIKHIKRVKVLTNDEIVLYYREISRYRRKSLIKNRIPFIVQDGQMFLPFLGLDLKKAPEFVDKKAKTFSTSTQVAFLYFLYNKDIVINTTEFARTIGFTNMTASRALNELYDARLVNYEVGGKTGRSKNYKRISDPEYFQKGHPYLKNPVKRLAYVQKSPNDALTAGLEALAEMSMLNPPGYQVRAVTNEWLNQHDIETIDNKDIIKDKKLVQLEVWDYDPRLLSDKKHVDLMSLYVTLEEEKDERVEKALENVMRGEAWYME